FRDVNPSTRRWSDGWWSSDYSRSGWCPGDRVPPRLIDLSGVLEPGEHTLTFTVEDVRPKDDAGHYGYWRVSAALLGWNE
ncbi:MAG: peptide-N-glycosidase, partial [Candidatus Eisenbacteria bacterium]|nr:peptide-N-glycosidase [Candidatus Eisenbacteria bacterium]